MTATTYSAALQQTSDAEFRDWGSKLSAAMTTCGHTMTADTGQINWATVTRPAVSTAGGYEIREFTDTMAASYPVFVKYEYGTGTAAALPALWITVGTGSDGAGNITGVLVARFKIGTAISNASSYESRVTGDTDRIAFILWNTAIYTNSTHMLSIERSHDAAGDNTNEGVLVFSWSPNITNIFAIKAKFSGSSTSYTAWSVNTPNAGTGADGADIYVYPIRTWAPYETEPSKNIGAYYNVDLTARNALNLAGWWGATVNMFPIGPLSAGTPLGTGLHILFRND